MISKTENKSKSRMREKKTIDTRFSHGKPSKKILTWKTSEEIKNHRPTTDRKHLL